MSWISYGIALGAVILAIVILEILSPWVLRRMAKRAQVKVEIEAWTDGLSRRYCNLARARQRSRERADG